MNESKNQSIFVLINSYTCSLRYNYFSFLTWQLVVELHRFKRVFNVELFVWNVPIIGSLYKVCFHISPFVFVCFSSVFPIKLRESLVLFKLYINAVWQPYDQTWYVIRQVKITKIFNTTCVPSHSDFGLSASMCFVQSLNIFGTVREKTMILGMIVTSRII